MKGAGVGKIWIIKSGRKEDKTAKTAKTKSKLVRLREERATGVGSLPTQESIKQVISTKKKPCLGC